MNSREQPGHRGVATPLQHGLYLHLLSAQQHGMTMFNVPIAVDIQSETAVGDDRWKESFYELCTASGADSETFEVESGSLMRVATSHGASAVILQTSADALAHAVSHEAMRPFELGSEPLIRGVVFKVDEGHATVLVVAHHLLADGPSVSMLTRDWIRRALGDGVSTAHGELTACPRIPTDQDYARWGAWHESAANSETRRFWARQADWMGARRVASPPRPGRPAGQLTSESLPRDEKSVREVGAALGVSESIVWLASLAIAWCSHSGQTSLVMGIVVSVRQSGEEQLVGHFANVVPVAIDLDGAHNIADVAYRVQEGLYSVYPHARLPLHEILAEAGKASGYQVMQPDFYFVDERVDLRQPPTRNDLSVSWRNISGEYAKFPLLLSLYDTDNGYQASLQADRTLLAPDECRDLAGLVDDALSSYVRGDVGAGWRSILEGHRATTVRPDSDLADGLAGKHVPGAGSLVGPPDQQRTDVVAVGAVDACVRRLWRSLLGESRTQTEGAQNFFDAGGTSMVAVMMQRALVEQLGLSISILDIFENPTLEHLIGLLERRAEEDMRLL